MQEEEAPTLATTSNPQPPEARKSSDHSQALAPNAVSGSPYAVVMKRVRYGSGQVPGQGRCEGEGQDPSAAQTFHDTPSLRRSGRRYALKKVPLGQVN